MNICPRCSRPLEPGEELCPSCKSKNDREGEERVPVDALGPIWLAATCPPADKKEVDEEKRQYIASALTAISGRNCLDQCPIAVLDL